MKKIKNFIILIIILIVAAIGFMEIFLTPVSKVSDKVEVVIASGKNKIEIVDDLKKAGVIKNKYATLMYVFLKPNSNLQAGEYVIDKKDSSKKIINQIIAGDTKEIVKTIRITFVEGKRIIDYAKLISENFDIAYEDILDKLKDKDFLQTCIDNYYFIDDSILNSDIYYSLEGYFYPETYEFYENSTIEEILYKVLNTFEKKLEESKEQITSNKYSFHEILTIASIIEHEGKSYEDRTMVSQVIYKRLEKGSSLGMDTTAIYGAKTTIAEVNESGSVDWLYMDNPYNTRKNVKGLPVGPICNPSSDSIKAALNPSDTDYEYFVADKNGKDHFFKTYDEFSKDKYTYMEMGD